MDYTAVVVPCYNEEFRLDVDRFAAFAEKHSDVRIIFVDDGSTDKTGAVLRELVDRRNGALDLVALSENVGKAEAVRLGMRHALREQPAFVGYWDADLSTPLEEVLSFRDVLSRRPEVEMVFGSRVKLLGRTIERSELRHYLGRVFATAVSLMLQLPVYDTQCGAKLFRGASRLHFLFDRPFQTEWFFDVEIVARYVSEASKNNELAEPRTAIYEYPLMQWVHVADSKVGVVTFIRTGFDLLKIFLHYELYRRNDRLGN